MPMNPTEKLIQLINQYKFKDAIKLFSEKASSIEKNHVDERDNTLTHITIKSISKQLFQYAHTEKYGTYENLGLKLVKELVGNGCPYTKRNFDGLLPIDVITRKFNTSKLWKIRNNFKGKVIKIFETKEKAVFSGIRYVKNFKFYRSSSGGEKCFITNPASDEATIHQELASSYAKYFKTAQKRTTEQKIKNAVVANIGFIISKTIWEKDYYHERRFVTYPIIDKNYFIVRDNSVSSHSEVQLCAYLSRRKNLIQLLKPLCHSYKEHKIYTVVLDIHSKHESCRNCQERLHDTQRGHSAFLHILADFLKAEGFILPTRNTRGIEFSSRAFSTNTPPLKLVIRISSRLLYDDWNNEPKRWYMPRIRPAEKQYSKRSHDIKKFAPDVIFHISRDKMEDYRPALNKTCWKLNKKPVKTRRTFFVNTGNGHYTGNIKWNK